MCLNCDEGREKISKKEKNHDVSKPVLCANRKKSINEPVALRTGFKIHTLFNCLFVRISNYLFA